MEMHEIPDLTPAGDLMEGMGKSIPGLLKHDGGNILLVQHEADIEVVLYKILDTSRLEHMGLCLKGTCSNYLNGKGRFRKHFFHPSLNG